MLSSVCTSASPPTSLPGPSWVLWGVMGAGETPVPCRPKLKARVLSLGAQRDVSISPPLFLVCLQTSFAPLPKSLNPGSHLRNHGLSSPRRYAVSASLVSADPPSRSRKLDKTQVRQPCRSAGRIRAEAGGRASPFPSPVWGGGLRLCPVACAGLRCPRSPFKFHFIQIWFR